jgi:type IV pilus assembly protein PilM
VITAVPGPAVIIKRATFPAQEPVALEETIMFEAGNFIPESLENVNLDYQVLDQADAENVDVLLVAVRKDVLNSYIDAIGNAGLMPVVVPVGGRHFTEVLAQELGISHEQAEALKIRGAEEGSEREEFERIITASSEQLLDEVQRALSFFWTGSTEEQVSAIYLSGGTAPLHGLASALGERLQIPVEVSNPFRMMNLSRQADDQFIYQNASALAVSVGLATRRPGDK